MCGVGFIAPPCDVQPRTSQSSLLAALHLDLFAQPAGVFQQPASLVRRGDKRRTPAFSVGANPHVPTPYAPVGASLGPWAARFSPRHRATHVSALGAPIGS